MPLPHDLNAHRVVRMGPWQVDLDLGSILRCGETVRRNLRPQNLAFLRALVDAQGRPVTYSTLANAVWPQGADRLMHPAQYSVQLIAGSLRQAFHPTPVFKRVKAGDGAEGGYRLIV